MHTSPPKSDTICFCWVFGSVRPLSASFFDLTRRSPRFKIKLAVPAKKGFPAGAYCYIFLFVEITITIEV